jgi:hypothetical protein
MSPAPWLALASIAALPSLLASCVPAGNADLDVQDYAIVGDELRMVVETSRDATPVWSHSSKIADRKGWYVTIDLASTKPLAERAHVFGPMWDAPDSQSWMSARAGVNFTEEDAAAARQMPQCTFDVDGVLLRFMRDAARGTLVRDALVAGAKSASWKRQGDVERYVDQVEPMSEDRLLTRTGRWCLLRMGRFVQLVDLHTGKVKDDPWLTGCFAQARSIPRFENVDYALTEELDHLVVTPVPKWNVDQTEPVTTFELDGKTHDRGDVGIAYRRPDPTPHLFSRKLEPGHPSRSEDADRDDGPDDAFSFGGELRLFSFDHRVLRLWRPDGGGEVVKDVGEGLEKKLGFFSRAIHPPGSERLLLFHFGESSPETDFDDVVGVATWDCAANTITDREARIVDLFELHGGELRPKALLPIE